jgi:hypothetical protein
VRHSLHDLAQESGALRLLIRSSIPISKTVAACIYASARACQQHVAIGYSARMAVGCREYHAPRVPAKMQKKLLTAQNLVPHHQ